MSANRYLQIHICASLVCRQQKLKLVAKSIKTKVLLSLAYL